MRVCQHLRSLRIYRVERLELIVESGGSEIDNGELIFDNCFS